MQKQYLEAGKIVGTQGVRGEVRIDPWCDSADFLRKFRLFYLDDEGKTSVKVLSSRVRKEQLVAALDGVDSVEKADVCRGRVIYLRRTDIPVPEGKYFIADLIGLNVYDADSFVYYGTLTEVLRTGANDVYQITSLDKKTYLVPAVAPMICGIDFEKEKMFIRPIKGIFDNED